MTEPERTGPVERRIARDVLRWASTPIVIAWIVYVLGGGEQWLVERTSEATASTAGVVLAVLALVAVLVSAHEVWQWYNGRDSAREN